MSNAYVPSNFEEWKHCITVECGLKLTPDFIEQRIKALENGKDHYSQQFLKLYGKEHYQAVLGWFKQAQSSVMVGA